MAALTFGVAADIGVTFKLQAELVLEIAATYSHELTENEKRKIILSITGSVPASTPVYRKRGNKSQPKATAQLTAKIVG